MTQYSKVERKKIAAAFHAAKSYVSPTFHIGDKEQFICHALERCRRVCLISEFACEEARYVIMERLHADGGGNCLEVFLERKVGYAAIASAGRDAVQQYRHRWLDALIKEFSK
jgi:hypothetical protein